MCKVLVFIPAAVTILFGVAIAFFPTWLSVGGEFDFGAIDPASTLFGHPLYLFWVAGLILIAFGSAVMCMSTDNRLFRFVIPVLAVAIIVLVLWPVFADTQQTRDNADSTIKGFIAHYKDDPVSRAIMDGMQVTVGCCGSTGYQDWLPGCIPKTCFREISSGNAIQDCGEAALEATKNILTNAIGQGDQDNIFGGCLDSFMTITYLSVACVCLAVVLGVLTFVGKICSGPKDHIMLVNRP